MLMEVAKDGIESFRIQKPSVRIHASCLFNPVPATEHRGALHPQLNTCVLGLALSSISNKQSDSPINMFSKRR
jgi:hypothetical protein